MNHLARIALLATFLVTAAAKPPDPNKVEPKWDMDYLEKT